MKMTIPKLPYPKTSFVPSKSPKTHKAFLGHTLSSSIKMKKFRSMDEFWAFYVKQHSKAATRRWHCAGTICSIMVLLCSLVFNWWLVFLVPLVGYGMAWYSHFFVEGNVPATFGHPFWSLLCDYKMCGLMLTGNMDKEMKRLGKRPVL